MEEKLINFVKENSFIYDKTRQSYKNVVLKEKKWKEFSDEIGEPVQTLKKRWKTLRDRFQREKKKIYNTPSGSGASSPKPQWKYYQELSFLNNCYSTNFKTTGNFERPSTVSSDYSVLSSYVYEDSTIDFGMSDTAASYISSFQPPEDNDEQENIEILEEEQSDDFVSIFNRHSHSTPEKQLPHSNKKCKPNKTTACPGKRRKPLSEENINTDMEIARKNMSELCELAKSSFMDATPAKLFFHSLAVQVDKENLSSERFAALQKTVLNDVHEQIALNKAEKDSNS